MKIIEIIATPYSENINNMEWPTVSVATVSSRIANFILGM